MLRFLHTADWQLGATSHPVVYKKKAISKLIELAYEHDVRLILGIGDIFDKPHPDQKVKDYLLSQIVNTPDIHFLFTVGNHDYTTKARNYHSLMYLKLVQSKLQNVRVCEFGVHESDKFNLVVLKDDLRLPTEFDPGELNRDKPVILAWHGFLPDLDIKSLRRKKQESEVASEVIKKCKADYFALGDIHKRLKLSKRCCYPGALVQKTYDCEDGVVLVEIDEGEVRTRTLRLDLPKRVTVDIEFEEGKDSEDDIVELIKEHVDENSLVKIRFELPMSTWSTINKKKVKAALLGSFTQVKLENNPVPLERNKESLKRISKTRTFGEELDVLLEEESSGLDKKRLRSVCLKHMQ
jgi:DNA repair exonuclease SbcCD nuclease subunit